MLFDGLAAGQLAFPFTVHQMVSLLPMVLSTKVLALAPTIELFLYQRYIGAVPPFTTPAVKITLVPGQTGLEGSEVIVAAVVDIGFTLNLSLLLVTDFRVAQGEVTVSTQETESWLFKLESL